MTLQKDDNKTPDGVTKKGIKKIDTVVTGVILGGIIASLYGVSKLREKDEHEHHAMIEHTESPTRKKSLWKKIFGK